MKSKFFATFSYVVYLTLLVQGCSGLKSVDQVVTIELPKLDKISKIQIEKVSPLKTAKLNDYKPLKKEITSKVTANKKVKVIAQRRKTRSKISLDDKNLKPIKKEIKIALPSIKKVKESIKKKNTSNNRELKQYALNNKRGYNHYGFDSDNKDVLKVSWSNKLSDVLNRKMVILEKIELETENAKNKIAEVKKNIHPPSDEAQPIDNIESYDPNNKVSVSEFVNDELDLTDIVKKKDSGTKKNDEIVFIDYSKENSDNKVKLDSMNIAMVAKAEISSSVQGVINREMGKTSDTKNEKDDSSKLNPLLAYAGQNNDYSSAIKNFYKGIDKDRGNIENDDSYSKSANNNQVRLSAIEADLGNGFGNHLSNFDFVPSYNTNEVIRDYAKGEVNIDYSLSSQTGVLRGTILKGYYMRTTFEIPMGSEYSNFQIPLISQESMQEYLDKNTLSGYGGYYLVDLGEMIEDVDLEKYSNTKSGPYEHRVLLDEDFKVTKMGKDFRYILFVGVEPGNMNVRYLGVNGQETFKITFIAPDEITYDFSQIERPHTIAFQTKLRNTLGVSPSPIDLSSDKITSFVDGNSPIKKSMANFEMKMPWAVKGMRNYLEMNYLEDTVFVGIDRDQNIELPSREFIGEILRSFRLDELNKECIMQINFSEKVDNVSILSEGEVGPTNFDYTYLDKDGVFTPEISPLSEKYFALGYEEGIFNIKVDYASGKSDYLRTYCSPNTYLVEQL